MLRVIVCEIYVAILIVPRVFVGKTLFRCVITSHCPRHNERDSRSIFADPFLLRSRSINSDEPTTFLERDWKVVPRSRNIS